MIRFGRQVLGRVVQAGEDISLPSKAFSRPRNTVAPALTGTPEVGAVLTYVAGTWVGFSSVVHEWHADGQFLQFSGASYTVTADDAGRAITVLEQAMNGVGAGASSRSNAVVIP